MLENVGRRSEVRGGEFSRFVVLGDKSLNGNEHNRLWRNQGTDPIRFLDTAYAAGADRIEDGRGVVATDVDLDGDLDLIVQSYQRKTVLLINQGPTGNWLQMRLRGTASNRDAIGARVVAEVGGRKHTRLVTSTEGYLSGSSLQLHFGLGEATTIDRLTVYWPSGQTTELEQVAVNQRLNVVEGEGQSK